MKKLIALLFINMLSLSASALDLEEGVHYQVISESASPLPTVTEYFSFYCPHCFSFEPLAKSIKESSNNDLYVFSKSHVDFMRSAPAQTQSILSRALIAATHLENETIVKRIFERIHVKKETFNGKQDVLALFAENDISASEAEALMYSDQATARLNNMKTRQDILSRAGILKGVPTFIVNDKYKILPEGFKAKSYEDLFTKMKAAIDELSQSH